MAKRKNEIPDYVIDVGVTIREIRKTNGKSVEEIAFKAGIDAQNLRKYELGRQEMKISMLKRISDAMGVKPTEILSRLEK